MKTEKIIVGISSCLLGEKVRFDGGHKKDPFITQILANYVTFQPMCPEVEAGLGVPRPPIRLMGDPQHPQVVEIKNIDNNFTSVLKKYSEKKVKALTDLTGFILKSKSPSCGMERVKVYQTKGAPNLQGQGIFAKILLDKLPWLPIEEEGRLCDPRLRENFIERLFLYRRWQDLILSGISRKKIIDFHSSIKYSLMSHGITDYQRLGRMVADIAKYSLNEFANNYICELMKSFQRLATRKTHTNVLQHCMGYVKQYLDSDDKHEFIQVLQQFKEGNIPLIVPITLLKHYLRKYPSDYLENQFYLNPYPHEFMLRNYI